MSRISQEVIDRVRNASDIVEVVSQYVDLKQRGRNFFGICPFHQEKTASFSVAPEKEIYHCFGCGAGGNAFNFIMEIEKISFIDSVRRLGERYGIEVVASESEDTRELVSLLYDVHTRAMRYFERELYAPGGEKQLQYLLERGLSKETLKEFNVGFSPDKWDALYKLAIKAGFKKEAIEKSGLFSNTRKGWMDRFRGRIIFPISNLAGKTIGFGGRAIDPEDPAKYLNSPETPIYYKTNVFYGLSQARNEIRQKNYLVLVEGYMDFLQVYQAGIKNVIAVSGTAFSDRHVAQLRKFTTKVVLAYDGDKAGISAAVKAGYFLLQGGLEPKILVLPDGQDPDDYIRENGGEKFQECIDSARPVLLFQMEKYNVEKLSAPERARFVESVVKEVALISDRIIQDDMIKTLADKLHIPEDDVIQRLRKVRRQRYPSSQDEKQVRTGTKYTSGIQKAQVELIRLLLKNDPEIKEISDKYLDIEYFTEPVLKEMAEFLIKAPDSDNKSSALVDIFTNPDDRQEAARILVQDAVIEESSQTFHDCMRMLKSHPLREKIKVARITIRDLETKGEDPTNAILEVAQLQEELRQQLNE